MKLLARDLGKEIDGLTKVAPGKYLFVYASAEASVDKKFFTMLA